MSAGSPDTPASLLKSQRLAARSEAFAKAATLVDAIARDRSSRVRQFAAEAVRELRQEAGIAAEGAGAAALGGNLPEVAARGDSPEAPADVLAVDEVIPFSSGVTQEVMARMQERFPDWRCIAAAGNTGATVLGSAVLLMLDYGGVAEARRALDEFLGLVARGLTGGGHRVRITAKWSGGEPPTAPDAPPSASVDQWARTQSAAVLEQAEARFSTAGECEAALALTGMRLATAGMGGIRLRMGSEAACGALSAILGAVAKTLSRGGDEVQIRVKWRDGKAGGE